MMVPSLGFWLSGVAGKASQQWIGGSLQLEVS